MTGLYALIFIFFGLSSARLLSGSECDREIDRLFDVCRADPACRRVYNLPTGDAARSKLAFAYMVKRWPNYKQALRETREAKAATTIDLYAMRAKASEVAGLTCGANQRFIFSADRMRGECVCMDDRNCEGNGLNLATETGSVTLSTLALVLASLLLSAYVLQSLYVGDLRRRAYVRAIKAYEKGKPKERIAKTIFA